MATSDVQLGKVDLNRDVLWRQTLVPSALYLNVREDRASTVAVTSLLTGSLVSDVVFLRHISTKAMALILALHGEPKCPGITIRTNEGGAEPSTVSRLY